MENKDRYFVIAYYVMTKTTSGVSSYIGSMALFCGSYPELSEIQKAAKNFLETNRIECLGEVVPINIMELNEQDYDSYLGGHRI